MQVGFGGPAGSVQTRCKLTVDWQPGCCLTRLSWAISALTPAASLPPTAAGCLWRRSSTSCGRPAWRRPQRPSCASATTCTCRGGAARGLVPQPAAVQEPPEWACLGLAELPSPTFLSDQDTPIRNAVLTPAHLSTAVFWHFVHHLYRSINITFGRASLDRNPRPLILLPNALSSSCAPPPRVGCLMHTVKR